MKVSKLKFNYNFSFLFLWMMILTIPLSLLFKVNVIGTEFSISYIFLALFILVSILSYFFIIRFDFSIFRKKVFLGFILSFLMFSLNSLYNGIEVKYLIFLTTFLASIVTGFLYSEQIQKYFQKQFKGITYVLVLIGLILYYFNIPLFDFESAGSELYFTNSFGYYRLSSILLNPNSFAYFLLLYFTIYLYSKKNIIENMMMLIVLLAFILTESRSALSGFLLALIIFNYQYFKQKILLFKLSIFGLLFGFVLLLVFTSDNLLVDYDVRFSKFAIALQYIFESLEYFLLGVPEGIAIEKNGISFSDNMFLYLMLKMGIIPFILFVYGYFYSIFKASKILFKTKNTALKPYALFLIATLLPMFFSNLLLFSPVYILIGLAIGVLEKGVRYEKSINS